jgi:hypothetical protein
VDDAACAPYALYPVDRVQRWFAALDLPKQDRLALTGRTSLFWKVFSDVRVEDLLVAHDPPDGLALDSMLNRRRRASQGIFAGSTSVSGAPALVMGVSRYWDVTSRRWPDLGVEGNFVLPSGRRGIPELLLFGSYPVDATVNAFAGVSLTSNRNTNADILLGTDIRVGIVRVRPFRRIRDGVTGARIAVAF